MDSGIVLKILSLHLVISQGDQLHEIWFYSTGILAGTMNWIKASTAESFQAPLPEADSINSQDLCSCLIRKIKIWNVFQAEDKGVGGSKAAEGFELVKLSKWKSEWTGLW